MNVTEEQLEALWSTVGVEVDRASTAGGDFTESICPETLPALALPGAQPRAVELRGEIGRGGMGVVHLGFQLSLRREVAVKVVPGGDASRDQRAAAREALVAAHLEHPNILPVYSIETSEDGEPLIVMRRIDGVAWSECIEEPSRAPRMRRDDPLGWHLEVFLAVCRAVQFAHERGILHRDIKPDNVLIGSHGDVYLMDWGLAATLDPALAGRAPLVSEVTRIAGTPGYMAPEMVRGDGAALGPPSDVYLLGATLHEALTGSARHGGEGLMEVLSSTLASAPYEYGPQVPRELARVCNRATHRDPERRHATVAELAADVRELLDRRPALRFLEEGQALLSRLRSQLQSSGRATAELTAIDETVGACRSAFDEALRLWPDNPRVAAGRDRAHALMARHEMSRGNLDDAGALLEAMSSPDEELRARLDELRAEADAREQEYDRLKRLEREVDFSRGGRTKAVLVALFGLSVFAHNVIYARLRSTAEAAAPESLLFLAGPILLIVAMGFVGFLWRRGVFRNLASRQVLYVLLALGAAVLAIRLLGAAQGVPPHQTYAYLGGVYAFGAAQVASMTDRRIYGSAAILLAATAAALVWPALTFELIGSGVLLATMVMAVVWWRRAGEHAHIEEPG